MYQAKFRFYSTLEVFTQQLHSKIAQVQQKIFYTI